MRVLLVPNTGKPETKRAIGELVPWLLERGHEPVLTATDADACERPDLGASPSAVGPLDLAVALGGDGTIIKAAHLVGDTGAAVMGINFGRVGFLTGAESERLIPAVEAALAGEARVEQRMTLEATLTSGDRELGRHRALNEVFVGRRGGSRVVDLSVSVNGRPLAAYTCDGIIVASPTGSTAYALSAGGPIVSPHVRGLVLVPVAPHTLADRALVLGPQDSVEISCVTGRSSDVCLTVDGQEVPCRVALERVTVWASERDVTLLRLDGRDFLDVASSKFLGG